MPGATTNPNGRARARDGAIVDLDDRESPRSPRPSRQAGCLRGIGSQRNVTVYGGGECRCHAERCRRSGPPAQDRMKVNAPAGGVMTERTLVWMAVVLVWVGPCLALSAARADNVTRIELSDERAFPESLIASADGTLYVG